MAFDHTRQAALNLLAQQIGVKAQELRSEVVKNLSEAGTGRRYKRGSIIHIASAPGKSPAVDRGRLRQSISAVKVGDHHWRVGSNLIYAPLLEFGTSRLAPRPFLRPALQAVRSNP